MSHILNTVLNISELLSFPVSVQFVNIDILALFHHVCLFACAENLTLSPPIMTIVPCANNLDPDEMPCNSVSHPDPSCLTLRQHFY